MKNQINRIRIQYVILGVVLFCFNAYAQGDKESSLQVLIDEAKTNNPRIQEAFHKWKAAEYKTKSVKSLDDPIVGYGYFGEEVQTRVGPQEMKYSASQKVPFPGKRHLKGKIQSKATTELEKEYEAVENEIIKEVKFVYFDLYWIDRSVEINEEEKSILEKIENVAQRKYESNLSSQQDVVKVSIELSRIIEKLFMLRQNRKSLNVRLNRLLNREILEDIIISTKIENQDFNFSLEEILAKADESRQELLKAQLSVERAEYEKSLAKMSYLPDFTLGAEYIEIGSGTTSSANDGQDAWVGMVSVNVPIWFGKVRAQIKEKESLLAAAKEKQGDVKNMVSFEVQDLYLKIKTYQDTILLYETALLPQAQQAFDISQTGFETGVISFLDWLDTERTFLQTRLAYYKAVTDYYKSVAYLERVVGKELFENGEFLKETIGQGEGNE